MPKKAPLPLEISKSVVHRGTRYEKTRWLLWSRTNYSGARVQRYFVTRDSAEEERDKLLGQNAAHGAAADALTASQRADAVKALAILAGRTALEEAANVWVKVKAPKGGAKTVREVIDAHITDLKTKGNQESYLRAQKIALGVFARGKDADGRELGGRNIRELSAEELSVWLHGQGWETLNLRNYARDVSMLFNYGVRREWVDKNPMESVTRPKLAQKVPDIYTPSESAKVLSLAADHDLLPFSAIGLFGGVRVEELLSLRWEWFFWQEKELRIPGWHEGKKVTKTGQPRMVPICPALRAWLKSPPPKGPIVNLRGLRDRREELAKAAGVAGKRNALRHTFASHHAALYRDPGALQMTLGQQTPTVLFKHYVAAVSKRDGKLHFDLRPKARTRKKIASIKAAVLP